MCCWKQLGPDGKVFMAALPIAYLRKSLMPLIACMSMKPTTVLSSAACMTMLAMPPSSSSLLSIGFSNDKAHKFKDSSTRCFVTLTPPHNPKRDHDETERQIHR